ncbi:DUF3990 domain-containing protein [Oscillospiraceae bacterium NTUH-002-81]|nr:DUF3990 domain-containing protein [Oscillospiraceae bacterium NTUH-002-81]
MRVYHGTTLENNIDIYNNGIDLSRSNDYLDFGKGFYVTPNFELAKDMARRVAYRTSSKFPTVISFEYTENLELNYKEFPCEDMKWAKFIMANRVFPKLANELGLFDSNVDLKYDIIKGSIADGRVANIASDLRYGKIKPQDYVLDLSDFLKEDGYSYGMQIVFCSEKSLSCIRYIECDIIK